MLFEIAVLLLCSVYSSKIGSLLIYRPFLELLNPRYFFKIVEINVINTIRMSFLTNLDLLLLCFILHSIAGLHDKFCVCGHVHIYTHSAIYTDIQILQGGITTFKNLHLGF